MNIRWNSLYAWQSSLAVQRFVLGDHCWLAASNEALHYVVVPRNSLIDDVASSPTSGARPSVCLSVSRSYTTNLVADIVIIVVRNSSSICPIKMRLATFSACHHHSFDAIVVAVSVVGRRQSTTTAVNHDLIELFLELDFATDFDYRVAQKLAQCFVRLNFTKY